MDIDKIIYSSSEKILKYTTFNIKKYSVNENDIQNEKMEDYKNFAKLIGKLFDSVSFEKDYKNNEEKKENDSHFFSQDSYNLQTLEEIIHGNFLNSNYFEKMIANLKIDENFVQSEPKNEDEIYNIYCFYKGFFT